MNSLTFVTSFAGAGLGAKRTSRDVRHISPRCAMGDSIAPKITLVNTGNDGTSKLIVQWETIAPKDSLAVEVTGNSALTAALKSKLSLSALPAVSKSAAPAGVSPVDYYFPKGKRNIAPVITLDYDSKIAVSMDEINPVIGGIAANSADKASTAFWKAKTYKYSAPETPGPVAQGADPISTALFEKYFPSSRRNLAPSISIKAPAGDWDTSAYLQVGSEYVNFNAGMMRMLKVKIEDEEADLRAAAIVEKYFGKNPSVAPMIEINEAAEKVSFGLETITVSESDVEAVKKALKV